MRLIRAETEGGLDSLLEKMGEVAAGAKHAAGLKLREMFERLTEKTDNETRGALYLVNLRIKMKVEEPTHFLSKVTSLVPGQSTDNR